MNKTLLGMLSAGLAAMSMLATLTDAAPLPQRHPYQKALRDYLATLTVDDFRVDLQPVEIADVWGDDLDLLARYWVLTLERGRDIPSRAGIFVAPEHFTLAAIEAGEHVNMGVKDFFDPKDTAWWTQWQYPGNPYFGSRPLKLRAFVASAVDLIMQDEEHEQGKNRRSDFLGGRMIRYGYCYRTIGDAVPEPARQAYAQGLIRMFEMLENLTPQGSGGSDMEFFQLVGMWYAAAALGEDYPQRALARAHLVIDRITSRTGYELHGGAFDASYQGIALRFLTWAALLYEDPKINDALHKMLVLKSYLTLPEPDGTLFGPTHFNTGTAGDAPNDQWAWISRDAAMAMIDDEALYTVWARIGVPDEEAMRNQISRTFSTLGSGEASDVAPAPWQARHWNPTLHFAYDHYRPGFYARLLDLDRRESLLRKPPFGRNEKFIRDLNQGGEFLAARIGGYGVVIHTGAIAAQWARGVSGKSGGSLSAFWTPDRGTAIMGRCRATQSNAGDEWTDENGRGPYTWGVHAITGRGPNGHYFSSARIRDLVSNYTINGTKSAVVTVSGDLAGSRWADPQGDLKGSITYHREFHLDDAGLRILSLLTTDGKDKLQELWEMIPVFFSSGNEPATVALHVDGEWRAATDAPVSTDRIRLRRYDRDVLIVLTEARRVKMSPEITDGSYGRIIVRNVMIDLLDGKGAPAVSYTITPSTH